MKIAWRRTQTINITKIKYIKIDNKDKLYEVEKISFYDFSIKAVETDLKIGDVAENEVFDISEFKDFKVTLKNGNVDNIVEFVRKWNVSLQPVRVDIIDCGNETGLSRDDNRAQNYAVYLLGYEQIEVRPMAVKDAEHQLNLEISENEARKDFSKAERIDYARKLERIESLKAKERQATSTGGVNPQLRQISDKVENKRTDEIVSEKLGIGSRDTYRKEKYIVDNQNSLTPKDFSEWDEGKMFINEVCMTIYKY